MLLFTLASSVSNHFRASQSGLPFPPCSLNRRRDSQTANRMFGSRHAGGSSGAITFSHMGTLPLQHPLFVKVVSMRDDWPRFTLVGVQIKFNPMSHSFHSVYLLLGRDHVQSLDKREETLCTWSYGAVKH